MNLYLSASSGCLMQKCFHWQFTSLLGITQGKPLLGRIGRLEERLIKKKKKICVVTHFCKALSFPQKSVSCPPKSIHAMEDGGCREKQNSSQGSELPLQSLKCQAFRKCDEGQGYSNHPCPALFMMLQVQKEAQELCPGGQD